MRRVYRFILRGLLQAILAFVLLSLLLVLPFRWVNPPITMVMADRWIHSTEDFELRQSWLSWEAIP
ncbi:MAG TPA: monofunctional biosynthetic peptidoglycan transglycosylase, partial [Methylophaga sp.]|nr:monofunctional biosynthetic peptidoglycan transglycosylase [Methylophaga sp.]